MGIFSGLKPDFELELFQEGFNKIIGIDEVGRGSWAGPLVLGAYTFLSESEVFERVNDSKKVTKSRREKLFPNLINSGSLFEVSVETIDKLGIGKATEYGVEKLIEKFDEDGVIFLLDGNFPFLKIDNLKSIIDGDAKVYSIACASIIAKVYRDNFMTKLCEEFPEYGFEKHVGYGTKAHIEALKKFGVTSVHRKSYSPIAKLLR